MSTKIKKIEDNEEAWESGLLGTDPKHARLAPPEISDAVDAALGLKMIAIRLPESLIDSFKQLGRVHGMGYQPLMREALKRFADCEMKRILRDVAESTPVAAESDLHDQMEEVKRAA